MMSSSSSSSSSSYKITVFEDILDLLTKHDISFQSLHHEPTPTSEDSARVRGVDLSAGGKALVLKLESPKTASKRTEAEAEPETDENGEGENQENNELPASSTLFGLFVLSADRKLNTKAIKKEFRVKNVQFATKDELADYTYGLVPGAVPPFGHPILEDLPLFVDTSIADQSKMHRQNPQQQHNPPIIAFNAGTLTDSIIMKVDDYLKIAAPEKIFCFSKE